MIKFNPIIDLNYNVDIIYTDIVCLKPFELYCNIDANLTPLDGQFNVYVIDKCNNILDNITNQFVIQEEPNLTAFEFYLKKEYYKPVKLMLESIVNETYFYSNYFKCKENKLTFRIDYKNTENFSSFGLFQSTRFSGYFTNLEIESEVKTYIQETGKKISNRAILTKFKNFIFDKIDNFNYENLCEALANEIVYIDGIRITDKPLLKSAEIQGATNYFISNFKGAIDKTDIFTPTNQIFEDFEIINYLPKGTYVTGATIPNYLFEFNYNVVNVTNETIKIYKDNVLFQTLLNSDLTILNNEITANIDATSNGSYKIVIPANKFKNEFGLILPLTELFFNIQEADFLGTDFYNNDFLTD